MRNDLTQVELKDTLEYNQEAGTFSRIKNARTIVGTIKPDGYRQVNVCGNLYLEHRLAWLYMTGEWPLAEIDHINGDRADNRFENLREATRLQNATIRKKPSTNTSGFLGVSISRGKYLSQISHNNHIHYLGRYDTPEEAHDVYMKKAIELKGEFA